MTLDLSSLIDRDETKDAKISVKAPNGQNIRLDISYFPHRLTTEQDDDDNLDETEDEDGQPLAPAWDRAFCSFMAGWDLTGEVRTKRGELAPGTAPGIAVPLDPFVTQYLPLWLKQSVQAAALELEFPSRQRSTRSRRG